MARSSNPFDNDTPNLPSRSPRRAPATRKQSGGISLPSANIPWRLIIFLALCIIGVVLLIGFWDTITYILGKLISMLVILLVLVFLLRCMFRRRRR